MEVIDKTKELETKSVGSLLWAYALPAVISQIIASIYNIVDRIFLGQGVGPLAIAGLAITLPIMNVIHAFGSLVGVGSASRMSIVLGRKDVRWAEKILGNSMILTLSFSTVVITCAYIFLDKILLIFGASADTIAYAREYMIYVLPGMFFTVMTFNLSGLIRSSGYPKKSMWIFVLGAVLNVILDAIFIFGFKWGIAGAAWATTISMGVTAVVALVHFLKPTSFIRFKRHGWRPKLYIFKNILAIGMGPFLLNLASSGVVAVFNQQLLRYGGDLAVGAFSIVNTFGLLLNMTILGSCQGMQPIAGYNYGAGHTDRFKRVLKLDMIVNILIGATGAALCISFPRFFAGFFTHDAQLIDLTEEAMFYLLVMWGFIGFSITVSTFFQSIDKPWISIVTNLSRQVIFLIPMLYIIPNFFVKMGWNGLTGVWATCTVSDTFGFLLALTFLLSQRKIFKPGYVAPHKEPHKEFGPDKDEE